MLREQTMIHTIQCMNKQSLTPFENQKEGSKINDHETDQAIVGLTYLIPDQQGRGKAIRRGRTNYIELKLVLLDRTVDLFPQIST